MLYLTLSEQYTSVTVKQCVFYCVTGSVSELVPWWLSYAVLDPHQLVAHGSVTALHLWARPVAEVRLISGVNMSMFRKCKSFIVGEFKKKFQNYIC
jgi:hypothetical protein